MLLTESAIQRFRLMDDPPRRQGGRDRRDDQVRGDRRRSPPRSRPHRPTSRRLTCKPNSPTGLSGPMGWANEHAVWHLRLHGPWRHLVEAAVEPLPGALAGLGCQTTRRVKAV